MSVNLITGGLVLLVLVLISGLCHLKDKNHVRILLALILVLVLLMLNRQFSKENFVTMIDEDIMLGGGNRLARDQEQTSKELDVLQGEINVMKQIYLNNLNEATVENTPSVNLICSPPTTYFDSSPQQAVSSIESGFSVEDANLTMNQLDNLINGTNNLM
jgi:hypothetical protein